MSDNKSEPRILILSGPVIEKSIADAEHALFAFDFKDPDKPILLVIDTYGGSVHSMLSLYDTIRGITAPVHTIGLGKIMSAGVLLLAAGAKGYRKVGEHATLMIHPIKSVAFGDMWSQTDELEEMKRLQSIMSNLYSRHSNLTTEEIDKMMQERRELYFAAEDIVKMGFADAVAKKANQDY